MRRDSEAKAALADLLLRGDLEGVPSQRLIMAARLAKESRTELKDFLGKVGAQLNREGMTWEKIGAELSMPTMTIYNWSKPFM